MSLIQRIFIAKAAEYEVEAEEANDKFNKGYFDGKAEAFRLAAEVANLTDKQEILDVINGDS